MSKATLNHEPLLTTARGCVTPQVIHNWNETSGGDMELIDGYDILPTDVQEKVKRALEQGHVDDKDWKGVCSSPDLSHCILLTIHAGRRDESLHREQDGWHVRQDAEEEGQGKPHF